MDVPYIILLLVLLALAFLEWRIPSRSNKYFSIAAVVVFVFVAFRAPVVGADTWEYYRYAMGIRNFYNYDSREIEPLYELYNSFFRHFCRVGIIWMSVNTFIIFSPYYYILKKYVKYKTFGVLAFFLFFSFSNYFVALRQLLSLSLILWGLICVFEKRRQRYLVFICLSVAAWFMHTTAAVVAPLYLLAYVIPIKNRLIPIIAIVISAIAGVVLQSFNILSAFDFFLTLNYEGTERLQVYLENSDLNELSTLNITLRQSTIAIIAFLLIGKEKINQWFSKIYLVGVVLYNLFISVPMIGRMVMSDLVFVIFVLPWIFENAKYIKLKVYRQRVHVVVALLVIYFARSYIISNMDYDLDSEQRMHPYYFFFQDYHTHPSITRF